jgi:hypothetical protein
MYRALHGSNMSSTMMIHDLSLPYDTAEDFVEYTSKELGIWPLCLCPLGAVERPTFQPSAAKDGVPQPMLNIGLWGAASKNVGTFVRQNRNLEVKLTEFGGRKVVIRDPDFELCIPQRTFSSHCRMQHTWRDLNAAFIQASAVVILPVSSLKVGASPDLLVKSFIMILNF